jgi:MarR family transcriptional regulator, transcriptional regulator for hemolysin
MTGETRNGDVRRASTPARPATPGTASGRFPADEPTLDQLLAEPIVQLLMRRDHTDEATTRLLLQAVAARPVEARDDPATDDPCPLAWLLHETARLWSRRYDREVRALLPGMTRAGCAVLFHLARHDGVNQAALAQILDITPMTLVGLLDRLEAAGLVARMPHPDDRRAHVLSLTAKALPIVGYIYDQTGKTYDDLQLGISKAEASQLRALLCRIRSNLTDRSDEIPSAEPLQRCDPA